MKHIYEKTMERIDLMLCFHRYMCIDCGKLSLKESRNTCDEKIDSIFMGAVEEGNIAVVDFIAKKNDSFHKGHRFAQILHGFLLACRLGNLDMVKLIHTYSPWSYGVNVYGCARIAAKAAGHDHIERWFHSDDVARAHARINIDSD